MDTILGCRLILNNHQHFLSLFIKNPNHLNSEQKSLLFVKLKKKKKHLCFRAIVFIVQ